MIEVRINHITVAVGSAKYVLGEFTGIREIDPSILKFESTEGTWTVVLSPLLCVFGSTLAAVVGTDIYFFGGVHPGP
jgi:hypothetical protein